MCSDYGVLNICSLAMTQIRVFYRTGVCQDDRRSAKTILRATMACYGRFLTALGVASLAFMCVILFKPAHLTNLSNRGSHHSDKSRKRRQQSRCGFRSPDFASHIHHVNSSLNPLPIPRRYPTLRGYNPENQNIVTLHIFKDRSDEIFVQSSMLAPHVKSIPLEVNSSKICQARGSNPRIFEQVKFTQL